MPRSLFALLVAAQALFLWMFFAADALEQLALREAFGSHPAAREGAFAFAAEWRHGMAGNSPLYMPGFFAVAVAVWFFVGAERSDTASRLTLALVLATGLATIAAPLGAARVVASFSGHSDLHVTAAAPSVSARAVLTALYTLLTWTVFVIGARLALVRRSVWPLLPTLPLTAVLAVIRPWTVDDFTSSWWRRMFDADPFALGSAAAIPLVAGWLVRHTSRPAGDGAAPGAPSS